AYGEVPRDDVAAFLAALVDRPGIPRQIIELTKGATPINEALRTLSQR
ncbi:NAD-dependent dehydratase, partial [Pseudomonas syringae]|nr:NAD-dependent dehydratase [Pseudomonas syringae]